MSSADDDDIIAVAARRPTPTRRRDFATVGSRADDVKAMVESVRSDSALVMRMRSCTARLLAVGNTLLQARGEAPSLGAHSHDKGTSWQRTFRGGVHVVDEP